MWNNGNILPPGRHVEEETGRLMRDPIHHMGRRCRNWDYCGRGCYLITITLADRSLPLLGEARREDSAIDGGVFHRDYGQIPRMIDEERQQHFCRVVHVLVSLLLACRRYTGLQSH